MDGSIEWTRDIVILGILPSRQRKKIKSRVTPMHYSLPNLLPLPVNAGHPSVVVGGAAGAAGVNGDAAVAEPGGSGTPNAPRPTADKTGGNNNGNGR